MSRSNLHQARPAASPPAGPFHPGRAGPLRRPARGEIRKDSMAEFTDYVVAAISLAAWGRKEIEIAETEMPGLMALGGMFSKDQVLQGARISGSPHMSLQTTDIIEPRSEQRREGE